MPGKGPVAEARAWWQGRLGSGVIMMPNGIGLPSIEMGQRPRRCAADYHIQLPALSARRRTEQPELEWCDEAGALGAPFMKSADRVGAV